MSIIFTNPSITSNLPPTLAVPIFELNRARIEDGVHTTPDETCRVIEAFFIHLGRLWLSEFWFALENDSIDLRQQETQELLLLSIEKTTKNQLRTIGAWVGLSRRLQQFFAKHQISTVIDGLSGFTFGSFGETEHPVAKILGFRNQFAHGAFSAPDDIINEHYQLLSQLFQAIPGLWEQPILWSAENHPCRWEDQVWVRSDLTLPTEHTLYVANLKTKQFLPLTPFFDVSLENSSSQYVFQNSSFGKLGAKEMLNRDVLLHWENQYRKEYSGELNRHPIILAREAKPPSKILEELVKKALSNRGQSSLLRAHPGTGLKTILPYLVENSRDFDIFICWDIQPKELSQSSQCLLNKIGKMILQQVSSTEEPQHFSIDTLKYLIDKHNLSILLAIDGMEHSSASYRSEPLSVLAVCNNLIDLPITLVMCADTGSIREPIFYDQILNSADNTISDPADLQRAKHHYIKTKFHQDVLNALSGTELDLFAICDKLDSEDNLVFEPKVEYALWDLKPLLNTQIKYETHNQQTEQNRFWQLFHSQVLS